MKRNRNLQYLLIAMFNGVLFMNCSGFKAGGISLEKLSSVNCKPQLKAVSESSVAVSQCDDSENFTCERRVFSPFVQNGNYTSEYCGQIDGKNVCVNSHSFTYNTEGQIGDEFNREEFQCAFNLKNGDFPLFQTDGSSIMSALSNAVQSCRKRASL